MAEEDELYYLQPGYDVNSLTMPQLRNIFVLHDITYPPAAKKSQLVELFQQTLQPQARKLLRAQAKVRRTSKGITDVASSQDGTLTADSDDEREAMPPPPPPKTPRSRKSKSSLAIENGTVATPATTRRSRTPSARKSTSKLPPSDTDEAEKVPRSTRKVRKSQAAGLDPETPAPRTEERTAKLKRESLETGDSPFSDDNPFQSGISPPATTSKPASPRNRKSSSRKSLSRSADKSSSPTIKREESGQGTSKSTYKIPVSHIISQDSDDGIEVTEEFTPDAARELDDDQSRQVIRNRRSGLVRRKKQPASTAAKVTPWAVITLILATVSGWYRQEKIKVGYCDVGNSNWSLSSNPRIPDWVHENLQPVCEPCPQHATCYPDMQVKCDTNFIAEPHPLGLFGLIPLPPTCQPDSERERRVKGVADKAIEELRERRAAYECGDSLETSITTTGDSVSEVKEIVQDGETKLEVPEETLKRQLGKLRRKGMSEDEFEDLWRGALKDIMGRDEVQVTRDGSGKILLSSTSLANLPFTCAIRRSMVRAITENRIPLAVLGLILLGVGYAWKRVTDYRQATAQIPTLVAATLDRLATQAALKEDQRVAESFISVAQLRDDLLRNVFSARERERVWQGVKKIVEGNSNVRAATREGGKTGEWSRVWEWIGPVDIATGFEGRRSGGYIQSSPVTGADNNGVGRLQAGEDGSHSQSVRKWDEGRPIY